MQAHTDTLRLFFALPCPPAQASAIAHWRDGQIAGGRKVAPEKFHLTLAFLGAQPAARLEALKHLAAAIEAPRFELTLDGLVALGKGFVCLRPQSPPTALLQLAASLGQSLSAQGIVLDSRPFLPHLTLARQAELPQQGEPPAFSWVADRFVLYRSENTEDGVCYREMGSWPLTGPEAAGEATPG
ncbi:RNA 2',3'-cyclic phosphodiesterase [Stutzerimonas stutzeri]|uniref:RNA 2',3'-cyclic phosphodiesterase n=1 Tax=Stutzerimonas stutzeri TaxID=316 RepID=UPI001C2E1561|nr:RNA 2',3'-cyclic phosphodiesterase [Stutzerimonas stutzeri]